MDMLWLDRTTRLTACPANTQPITYRFRLLKLDEQHNELQCYSARTVRVRVTPHFEGGV